MARTLVLRIYDLMGNVINRQSAPADLPDLKLWIENSSPHDGLSSVAIGRVEAALDGEEEPERVVYSYPGAPPIGRRVRSIVNGQVFVRVQTTEDEPMFLDESNNGTGPWPWDTLIQYGPLELLPLTDQEIEDERIYGPIGARWGFPDRPCPYRDHSRIDPKTSAVVSCALGRGHIGPHLDKNKNPLGLDREFNPDQASDPSAVWCTCGQPGLHLEHCPRYTRLTGGPS